MILVAGVSLAAFSYNVIGTLSGNVALNPFKDTTDTCNELLKGGVLSDTQLEILSGAAEGCSVVPHPRRDSAFTAACNLVGEQGQRVLAEGGYISQSIPPKQGGKKSWDGVLDSDGGLNLDQWTVSLKVGREGTGWLPRILKGSTTVQECRRGINGGPDGSLLRVGVVTHASDPVLEAFVFVFIILSTVSVIVALRIAHAQLIGDLRHDLGNMLAAVESSFPSLQQPNFSGEEIRARLASFGETLKNFKLAVDSGREYVGEPSFVQLKPMLTKLLTAEFKDDGSEVPDRLVISFDKDDVNQSVPVAIDCLPYDLAIECWKDPIDRVLVNLLVNAARAATAAGDGGWVHVKVREGYGFVRIVVRNSGEEFPDAVLKSFRWPFGLRASPIGMGLTVIHRVARKHGGMARIGNRMNPETCNREAEVEVVLPMEVNRSRFRKQRDILRRSIRGWPKGENPATG